MKKFPSLVLATAFALTLPVVVGCGEAQGSTGDVSVSYIDVGKGDCILLQVGESSALIDAGYEETSDKVLSHLRKHGVSHLDYLIVTHYDRDHIGGVRPIGKALPIDAVYLPGYVGSDKNYRTLLSAVEDLRLPAKRVDKELSLKLGDAALDVFPLNVAYVPGTKGEEGNDNDLSLVATLTCGNDSYLFSGDLEEDGLEAYLKGPRGRFDVLKMPHHGQKSALTDELLDSVKPKVAIITDSANDPASKKTLKMLDAIGADAYCTSSSGTIVVQSDGAGRYSVSTDRG